MLECDNVNMTGPLVVYFVGNSLYIDVFLLLYKKIFLKECEVWQKGFSNKIIVRLITQCLLSSFLCRPVTSVSSLTIKQRFNLHINIYSH